MKTLTSKAMLIVLCCLMFGFGAPLNQISEANESPFTTPSFSDSINGKRSTILNQTDLAANVLDLPQDGASSTKLAQGEWTYSVTITVTAPATGWGKVEIFTNQKRDLLLTSLCDLPPSLSLEQKFLTIEQLEIKDQWGNDVTWTTTIRFWGIPYCEFHLNEVSEPPYFISYRVNLNRFIEENSQYKAYCSDIYALFAAPNAILLPKDEVQNVQYVEDRFQVNLDFQLPVGWETWVPAPKSNGGFRMGITNLFLATIGLGSLDKASAFSQIIDGTDYSLVVPQRDLSETLIRLSSFFTWVAEQNRCLGPILSPHYTYFLDPPGYFIFPSSPFGGSINSVWTDDGLINNDGGFHEMGHAWAAYVLFAYPGGNGSWGTEGFNLFYQWRSAMWPKASTYVKERNYYLAYRPPYDYNLTWLQKQIMQNYNGWLEFLATEGIPLAPMENIGMKWRDADSLFALFFSAIDAATKHQGDLDSLFQFLRYTQPKEITGVAYYTVADLQAALETLTASGWASFFDSYIYGTLPYPKELICRDTDEDGLWDTSERQIGTDISLPDSDGDGLIDLQELINLTDPLNPDTDFDGLNDGLDFFGFGKGIIVDGESTDWESYSLPPVATDPQGDSTGGQGTDIKELYAAKDETSDRMAFLLTVHDPPAANALYPFRFSICTDLDSSTEYRAEITASGARLIDFVTGREVETDRLKGYLGKFVELVLPLNSIGNPEKILVLEAAAAGVPSCFDYFAGNPLELEISKLPQVETGWPSLPNNPDTDGGGESDGSEYAAGRDPWDPSDDIGDNVPPIAETVFPLSGYIMEDDSFVAVGTATDNRGIERVEWRMDSGDWSLATGTSTWWAEIGPLSPGIHRMETRAKDISGNYSVPGLKGAGVLTSSSTVQVLPFPYDYLATTLTLTSSYRNLSADIPVQLESQIRNAQGIPLMGYTITTIVTSPAVLVLSGVTDENGIVRWDYVPPVSGKLEATAYFRSLTATLADYPPDLPYIVCNLESLTFSCTQGESNPLPQILEVWNAGTGTLNWTANEASPWLSLSPTSGSSTGEHDSVTVSVDTSGLVAGTYSATISIGAVGADNSPQQVPVTLTVQELLPSISSTPSFFTFSCTRGQANPPPQTLEVWNAGTGTLNWTASEASPWLSLSPTSGTSTGEHDPITLTIDASSLSAATYTATITLSAPGADNTPQSVEVTLTVQELLPSIAFAPSFFTFSCTRSKANPPPQILQVWNSGGGTLNWTANEGAGWLSLTPTAGSSTGEHYPVTVSIDASGLVVGTYSATISIGAVGADNNPQQVPVNLTVQEPSPSIGYSPASFTFSCTRGQANPFPQTLEVWNVGGGTLNWTANEGAGWLSLAPTAGSSTGEHDSVTVSVDTSGLVAGTYTTAITLSVPDADNTPQQIPVTLIVQEPLPSISSAPSSFTFSCTRGQANPPPQILEVWNVGGGTLNWTVSEFSPWLSLSRTSGSSNGEHDPITLSVDASSLSTGTYTATITLVAAGADNSPQQVPVTLTVKEPLPSIGYSQVSFTFSCTRGQANPSPQTLEVWNSGGGTLNWTASEGAGWLNLNPTSGSSSGEHDPVTLSVDASGLVVGTYTATITLAATGADNSPQQVPVTLTVEPQPPVIGFAPLLFTFTATVGEDNPATQILTLWNSGEAPLNWTVAGSEYWLTLLPTGGTNDGSVTVGADTTGLTAGTHSATIIITAPGAGNSPQQITVTLTLVPAMSTLDFNLVAGWNMISLPVAPASTNPNVVFSGLPPGWVMYAWDAANGRYIGKEQIVLGLTTGFWLKVSTPVSYPVNGQSNGAAQTGIDLGLGWNLIGVPYEGAIPWGAVRVSRYGGAMVTLDQAVSSDWIQNTFYRWSGSAYQGLTTGGVFQPLLGYWVKTKTAGVRLVFLKP